MALCDKYGDKYKWRVTVQNNNHNLLQSLKYTKIDDNGIGKGQRRINGIKSALSFQNNQRIDKGNIFSFVVSQV